MATENEKKFLKLLYLYDSNKKGFHAYIERLKRGPDYATFGENVEEYVINAIQGYKSYNDFMEFIQYFPDPDFVGFKPQGMSMSGGKEKKSKRRNKLRCKKTKKTRK